MADLSKYYKIQVQNHIRQKWVYDCLELLKKYNKNNSLDNVISYAKQNF